MKGAQVVVQVTLVRPDCLDHLVEMEFKVLLVSLETRVQLVQLEQLALQEHLVLLEQMDHLDLRDKREILVHPVPRVNWE